MRGQKVARDREEIGGGKHGGEDMMAGRQTSRKDVGWIARRRNLSRAAMGCGHAALAV